MPTIRHATLDDVNRIAESRHSDDGSTAERMRAYLEGTHHPQKAGKERMIFFAESEGGVLGYVGGHRTSRFGFEGELQYLYVHRDHRNKGIARVLVLTLGEWFENLGIHRICVNVAPENDVAISFYKSLGAEKYSEFWMCWESGFRSQ